MLGSRCGTTVETKVSVVTLTAVAELVVGVVRRRWIRVLHCSESEHMIAFISDYRETSVTSRIHSCQFFSILTFTTFVVSFGPYSLDVMSMDDADHPQNVYTLLSLLSHWFVLFLQNLCLSLPPPFSLPCDSFTYI